MTNILPTLIEEIRYNKSEHEINTPSSPFWLKISNLISKITPSELLNATVEHVKQSQYPTGSCIVHENGFFKISLFKDSQTELQIRLHFWPAGSQDTNIHNHRWHFISSIISGSMTFTNWETATDLDSAQDMTLYEVSDASSGLVKTKTNLGSTRLMAHSQYMVNTGTFHYCHKDVFHSGKANQATITLMITGAPTKPSTRVIFHSEARQSVTRTALSAEQQIELMTQATKELTSE
ncbi:hypothetical protein [Vibrio ouci]|uniref:Cysteine dioxygenase n=1 Tax=Vibrio ouci TaxID=2499078 RepID=A0A4Y8WJP7_9VIBR|nr:hypothetical protein [Vibrio ouci]TFH93150.1 hypothetical protein ELS82_01720 [Vibrio ouci]